MTVAELKAELEKLPKGATVHAYEGEGGCWITVWHGGREIAAFSVKPV